MPNHFDADMVQRIAEIEEVDIEPPAPAGEPPRRVTIWVVVVDGDVYVRSVNARRGQWYQRAHDNPDVQFYVDGKPYAVRAVPVSDPAILDKISDAYMTKYHDSPYAPPMIVPETLPTTLRLEPR